MLSPRKSLYLPAYPPILSGFFLLPCLSCPCFSSPFHLSLCFSLLISPPLLSLSRVGLTGKIKKKISPPLSFSPSPLHCNCCHPGWVFSILVPCYYSVLPPVIPTRDLCPCILYASQQTACSPPTCIQGAFLLLVCLGPPPLLSDPYFSCFSVVSTLHG